MLSRLAEQWEQTAPTLKVLGALVVTAGSGLIAGSFGAGRYTAGLEARVDAKADQAAVAGMAANLQHIRAGVDGMAPQLNQVVTDVAVVKSDVAGIKADISERVQAAEKVHDDHEARLRAQERKP